MQKGVIRWARASAGLQFPRRHSRMAFPKGTASSWHRRNSPKWSENVLGYRGGHKKLGGHMGGCFLLLIHVALGTGTKPSSASESSHCRGRNS